MYKQGADSEVDNRAGNVNREQIAKWIAKQGM
jgi:hypothetical protein